MLHSATAVRGLGKSLTLCLPVALGLLGGCTPAEPGPTRGYVLVSLDTLRADHLSGYGYERQTSPFLDSLAASGILFENAFAQYPSTLTSHMSLFTGLYPPEHGVYPPDRVLAEEIATLPEVFRDAGFRTAGFTEGGLMRGRFGFARGFEQFDDRVEWTSTDLDTTLERGLGFLRTLEEGERFFLLLHSYAVHAPYDPPPGFGDRYWSGAAPEGSFPPTGRNLQRYNRRGGELGDGTVDYFEALYDSEIAYADAALAAFFDELDALGLRNEVTVVVLSDHGEEFLEHGRFAHTQIYPEILRVPLVLVHPALESGRRIATPVRLVDVAPTLLELAELEAPAAVSGSSLAWALGAGEPPEAGEAYSEMGASRSLAGTVDGRLMQLVLTRYPATRWLGMEARFDLEVSKSGFSIESFREPRRVRIAVDGAPWGELEIGSEPARVELGPPTGAERRRVAVTSSTCTPRQPGEPQCFAFRIFDPAPQRLELFDLEADPLAQADLSGERPEIVRRLVARLRAYDMQERARPQVRQLDGELEERLRALGYLQ